jgi:hypothetical protein
LRHALEDRCLDADFIDPEHRGIQSEDLLCAREGSLRDLAEERDHRLATIFRG